MVQHLGRAGQRGKSWIPLRFSVNRLVYFARWPPTARIVALQRLIPATGDCRLLIF
jgi:hypothetical protein